MKIEPGMAAVVTGGASGLGKASAKAFADVIQSELGERLARTHEIFERQLWPRDEALQFFGARGYSRELPLERMARDVRMFTIGGGTAEVLRNVVAGALLKKKLPQTRDGWGKE